MDEDRLETLLLRCNDELDSHNRANMFAQAYDAVDKINGDIVSIRAILYSSENESFKLID